MRRQDRLDIAVRAYTESAKPKPPPRDGPRVIVNDAPSEWSLTFDTETTVDAAQALRIGVYQVRRDGALFEEGIFFEPGAVGANERVLLRDYAKARGLKLRNRWEFVHHVFYEYGYELGGRIIGFNLPFDLSRLAIGHTKARGSLRGGFSFALTKYPTFPRVRVKHLSRRAALIDFATPAGQDTPRGMRKRKLKVGAHRGFFVDVKTLAGALASRNFSLASLCAHLQTETRKVEADEHGGPLTAAYLDYARRDVQATWECFAALEAEYNEHGLTAPLHRILSEASIGKAYLEDMGVKRFLALNPDAPRDMLARAMSTYYGGRAEVRWRRTVKRVLYADFKSMYPTVNALMGLWRFVIAQGLRARDGTDEARAFLAAVTIAHLQDPAAWRWLTALLRVRPDDDLFPVRARYDDRVLTIGLNHLTCEQPLWFTLADVVVAKLLSGKTPVIEEAIIFEPGPPQEGLTPIHLFGREDFRVDPLSEDVFARLIDLRDEAKARRERVQKAIKIVANATSYGIFVEVNRDDAAKPEPVAMWGPDGARRDVMSTAIEQPGKYFNPVIATLITGAARLMLALAERRTLDEGLDWVFCDTDSLAIAKPDAMSEAEFARRTGRVVDWFKSLNPYQKPGSILQVEAENFDPQTGAPRPLYAFAISAKRYALFNLDDDGRPIVRKASAHGLGHLLPPYREDDAPPDIPPPSVPLSEIGVARWQYDLWFKIIEAGLSDDPVRVTLDHHPALQRPGVSRYAATSPELLAWFKRWNEGRAYAMHVKPFNFLLSFMGRNGLWAAFMEEVRDTPPGRGRPRKTRPDLRPVAPFDTNHEAAVTRAFDRVTGEPIARDALMTYAEVLAGYHLSAESKFANAGAMDAGRTVRRRVVVKEVRLIGKEGNRIDQETSAGMLKENLAEYAIMRRKDEDEDVSPPTSVGVNLVLALRKNLADRTIQLPRNLS